MPTLNIPPPRPYVQYTNADGTLTIQGYDLLYGMYLRIGGSLNDLNAATLADKTWDEPNPIGTTTPNVGAFTTLSGLQLAATVSANFTTSGVVTVKPTTTGTMDNMTIGATTPRAGTFTTLTTTGALNLSPATGNVTISPVTGNLLMFPGGNIQVLPTFVGTLDNINIGSINQQPGWFTTLRSSNGFGCNGAAVQTPVVSGAVLTAYAAGANGLSAAADMQALVLKVKAIDAALKANGILS